ncbi:MAG TPA: penicillin acylase family protein [Candidatus Binatia bacterium]|nr:penicillin acylase family protein [Candidatus Binatia bacterium]
MAETWRLTGEAAIEIERDEHGVPHVRAENVRDLDRGLGFCHGIDRALSVLLLRILGQGRASEILEASDDMLRVDRFFRRLNLAGGARAELEKIAPAERARFDAYCDGVETALSRRIPWELRWIGYVHEPWTALDSLLLSRMVGYVALAQSQGEIERLFVELVQAGVARARLEALFPVALRDEEVALLRRVALGERLFADAAVADAVVPHAVASNNWVIAPGRSASGHAILANDPHLETNRLPAVWYEVALQLPHRTCIAATMPGLPGPLLGRTEDLAWGATYSFMDAIDSWIEDCRDGAYRRVVGGRESWIPFRARKETIRRKGKPALEVVFHENDHGVLDGDPYVPGLYLATRWASGSETGARSLAASFAVHEARTVDEGRAALGAIETAWNWVLADREGNIGYQMSGLMPLRRPGWNGFAPVPGWDPENDWRGFAAPEDLPRASNPASGYLVTANDDLNHLGRVSPINAPMGAYRAERIASLLSERTTWTAEDVGQLQLDDFSLHAERLLGIVGTLLPSGRPADLLRSWDCRYDVGSRAATLFEELYRELLLEVFGPDIGRERFERLLSETGIVADFYATFDRVLFDAGSPWFDREPRSVVARRAAERVCERAERSWPPARWGEKQQIVMRHVLLGGRLPGWLGFDYGPIALPGNRATIRQGQVYRSGGRQTSFAPSFRMVADLGDRDLHTALAGGPSDRRFSRWYTSGVDDWRAGRFKVVRRSGTRDAGLDTRHGA